MYTKHFCEDGVEPAALFDAHAHGPSAAAWVGGEWVWEAVIETAGTGVGEAEGKDLEGGDGGGEEAAEEFEVEDGAPVCGVFARGWGGGHDVEGFTEVGGMLSETHEGAVEG